MRGDVRVAYGTVRWRGYLGKACEVVRGFGCFGVTCASGTGRAGWYVGDDKKLHQHIRQGKRVIPICNRFSCAR